MKNIEAIKIESHTWFAIKIDGKWNFWGYENPNKYFPMPEFDAVLGNAEDIAFYRNRVVYALFPKEKIPRSGIWKLEDLGRSLNQAAGEF